MLPRNPPSADRVSPPDELSSPLGRYRIYQPLSVGTITSVHIGLFEGAEQFRKTVAIKRLLAGIVHEPCAVAELTYEACVGAMIHHPNVVSVLDLAKADNRPVVVTEYGLGATIGRPLPSCRRIS